MNKRERVLAVLNNEEVDYVPGFSGGISRRNRAMERFLSESRSNFTGIWIWTS